VGFECGKALRFVLVSSFVVAEGWRSSAVLMVYVRRL
jgi:hypothetical protein